MCFVSKSCDFQEDIRTPLLLPEREMGEVKIDIPIEVTNPTTPRVPRRNSSTNFYIKRQNVQN